MVEQTPFWKLYWAIFKCGALLTLLSGVRRQWSRMALMLPVLAAGIRFGWRDPSGPKFVALPEDDTEGPKQP